MSAAKDFIIPSSPEDRKKIKDAVKEMSDSMTREDAEKEHRKAIIDRIHDEIGFDKSLLRKMAKDHFKNEFEKTAAEQEAYQTAYESIMKNS